MFASKGALNRDVQLLLVCVKFTFHSVNLWGGGGEPADCLELNAGFLGIRYLAFSDRMSLQLLMLPGKYI